MKYLLFFICTFAIACSTTSETSDLTFSNDIAPVVFENCSVCHYNEGPAPFPLTNYGEVKRKAQTIKEVISSGYMPPWPADTSFTSFIGEKKLSEKDIRKLISWIDGGSPKGFSNIEFKETSLEKPKADLVLKLPKIEIEGNNTDQFYIMKVPFELSEEKFIKLAVLVPGNSKIVHHCDAQLIIYEEGKKSDLYSGKGSVNVNDYEDYPSAFRAMNVLNDDDSYPSLSPGIMHYLPGSEWQRYPEQIGGFKATKQAVVLINQMHYGPSPKSTFDQSELHLFFSDKAPERPVKELVFGSGGQGKIIPDLVIPPRKISEFRIEYILPETISVLTVNPHMHLLGKDFEAIAIAPDGKETSLIRINSWDFRWQNFYNFKKPVILEAGSKVLVKAHFDNTSENPFNPNIPPILVDGLEGSMRSTDEMFQFSLNYMNYQEGDEEIDLSAP